MKYFCIVFVFFSTFFSSCYKQDASKYQENNVSLSFSVVEQSNGVLLMWGQASMSNFIEFIVTKNSVSTAPVGNVTELKSESIFTRIKDRNTTSIIDSTLALNSYYRLYINQGGLLIASDEILQKSKNYVLNSSSVNQLLVDYQKGNLYILNSDQSVELVDLSKMELKTTYENVLLPRSLSCSLGYDQDGNTEIYVPIVDQIQVLDGEKFNLKKSISNTNFQTLINNTATDMNSNIYYSDETVGILGGIFRYDSKTELITKINVCGDCRHYTFVMSRDGKRGIVGSLGAVARYFTINDKNQVNASVISQSIISSTSSQLFVLAEKSPTLIVGNSGTIFNQSFSVQKNLINEVPLFLQSIFDQEENYIYAIGGLNKVIVKFENKAGYNKLGSIFIKSSPRQIFIYDSSAFILGNVFDPNTRINKLIIEKVRL